MIEREYTIKKANGIDIKTAEKIVGFISSFECDIFLTYKNNQINMKSIMGFISLVITTGSKVYIEFIGTDAQSAADELDIYLRENKIV